MKRFDKPSVINAVSLGELHLDLMRGTEIAKFAYVNADFKVSFGFTELHGNAFFGKRTREILGQLLSSIEDDATRVLTLDKDSQPEEEDSNDRDPPGLADASEEPDQI